MLYNDIKKLHINKSALFDISFLGKSYFITQNMTTPQICKHLTTWQEISQLLEMKIKQYQKFQ